MDFNHLYSPYFTRIENGETMVSCRFSLNEKPGAGWSELSAEECQHDFGGGHALTVTVWLG